jgi:guanyl-specific ribonuclease Sa
VVFTRGPSVVRRHLPWLFAALALVALWTWTQRADNGQLHAPDAGSHGADSAAPAAYPDFLPREAHAVLGRIARGEPHPYRQDGGVFQNREQRLPAQPRGYYREYTVETPGSDDRGARRIVTGGDPPAEYWYTQDHYRSFRRFEPPASEVRP